MAVRKRCTKTADAVRTTTTNDASNNSPTAATTTSFDKEQHKQQPLLISNGTSGAATFAQPLQATTYQESSSNDKNIKFWLDYCWTYGPFGVSVVLVQKGLWEMQGDWLFPHEPVYNCLASLVLAAMFSVVLLHPATLHGSSRLTTTLMVLTTSLYFRGIWEFWDHVVVKILVPQLQQQPSWLQHLAGLLPGFLVLWGTGTVQTSLVGPPVVVPDDGAQHNNNNNNNKEQQQYRPLVALVPFPWSVSTPSPAASTLKEE